MRERFLDALSQQELRDEVVELHSELRNISAEIDDLRHDVSALLQKVLMELTDMEEDEVQTWMASRLAAQSFQPINDEGY